MRDRFIRTGQGFVILYAINDQASFEAGDDINMRSYMNSFMYCWHSRTQFSHLSSKFEGYKLILHVMATKRQFILYLLGEGWR